MPEYEIKNVRSGICHGHLWHPGPAAVDLEADSVSDLLYMSGISECY